MRLMLPLTKGKIFLGVINTIAIEYFDEKKKEENNYSKQDPTQKLED